MRKQTAPVERTVRVRSSIGDKARKRRVDLAYRAYVLKALRRFDFEAEFRSILEPRAPVAPGSAVDSES